MAIYLKNRQQLEQLLTVLNDRKGVHELPIIGMLKTILEGNIDPEVIVDRWPDVTTVVIKSTNLQKKGIPEKMCKTVFIYTTSQSNLEQLLRTSTAFQWSPETKFHAISERVKTALTKVAHEKGEHLYVNPDPHLTFEFSPGDAKQRTLPDGYYSKSLHPSQAGLVNSVWKYSDSSSEEYISYLISHYPSKCIYNPAGQPVVWATTHPCQAGLMAWTVPEERRKHLASCMSHLLANEMLQRGNTLYAWIGRSNTASLRYMAAAGHKQLPDFVYFCRNDPVPAYTISKL